MWPSDEAAATIDPLNGHTLVTSPLKCSSDCCFNSHVDDPLMICADFPDVHTISLLFDPSCDVPVTQVTSWSSLRANLTAEMLQPGYSMNMMMIDEKSSQSVTFVDTETKPDTVYWPRRFSFTFLSTEGVVWWKSSRKVSACWFSFFFLLIFTHYLVVSFPGL